MPWLISISYGLNFSPREGLLIVRVNITSELLNFAHFKTPDGRAEKERSTTLHI